MQSSCNVIKRNYVNSRDMYTINTSFTPALSQKVKKETECEKVFDLEETKAYAESIINAASEKAKAILDSARQDAERIKKDAYELSLKKGYNEGLKKGTEEGLHRAEDIRREAEDVLKEAHRVSREYISRQKSEIVNLSVSIAEKIIGYQADISNEGITNIIKNSMESAVMKGQVIIKVNPIDYPFVDSMKDELSECAGDRCIISIIRDDEIKRSGCRIETEVSSVDATIDTQLQKIKEALLG